MIRTATREDLPMLRDLLARANEAPYDIGRVAEEKCFGSGAAGAPRVLVFENSGEARGMAVICGKYLRLIAVAPDYRRTGIGSALLSGEKLVAGAEAGNYFTPGVVDSDSGTIGFLRARGFRETASTWNLTVRTDQEWARGSKLPERVDRADQERFLTFIDRQFGSLWRFEATRAFQNDPPTAFWIEDVGFAVHEANNRGLGTFGPTGVVKAERGKGYGRALVLAALEDLRRLGYTDITIPWTDAIDFYRRTCGAERAHRFITFSKSL